MLKTTLAAFGGAVICLATVGAALAMPLPAAPESSAAATLFEPVHGCHHGILRDRRGAGASGWHFHDRACLRHDTAPPGYANGPGARGSTRTPLCSYRCKFVGPVKTCEQVCR